MVGATKSSVDHSDGSGSPPPAKGGKIKRHFKRWWWVHLIIFLLGALVITLILLYVAFPKIAQHQVNQSSLNITSLKITNPRPDGYELETTNVIVSNSSYHPKLSSFNASLYLEDSDVAFMVLEIPAVKVKHEVIQTFSQNVTLTNMDAFQNFSTALLLNEEITIHVKGRTALNLGKFPTTHVNYKKTVTMKGLNSLKGVNIFDINVFLTPLASGTNMNGTAFIPNPSVVAMELGNLSTLLTTPTSENDTTPLGLGFSTILNVDLPPGGSNFSVISITNQSLVLNLISANPSYKSSGLLPVTIIANESVYDGTEIPYFTKSFRANNLDLELNVEDALDKLGLGSLFGETSSSSAATASATAVVSSVSSAAAAATTTAA